MYSISDAVVSYTPGSGYTAAIPGCPVKIRWGEEFIAQVVEKAKQNGANDVDRPVLPNGPGKYNPEQLENFDRRELSPAELRELAAGLSEKYDPRSMTQEDYDSFMDDLVEEGLLSEHELGALGYHGFVVLGSILDVADAPHSWGGSYWIDPKNPDWSTYYRLYGDVGTLGDVKGDMLAYTKMMSARQDPIGSDAFVRRAEILHTAYTVMANVLEAIQSQRSR
jgi:hypothetical protein